MVWSLGWTSTAYNAINCGRDLANFVTLDNAHAPKAFQEV